LKCGHNGLANFLYEKTGLTRKLQISELGNRGDVRGVSFSAPPEALDFVGRLSDMYVASTAPGAIRGNHYHLLRREAIVLLPGTPWSLHWDESESMPAEHRSFDGSSAILVLISPGASHAVRNDGPAPLWFVAISSETYDPSESVERKVV